MAPGLRAPVPIETPPSLTVDDSRNHLPRRSLSIGVLDAQHKRSAVTSRVQPVEECRARTADVEVSGWGWREANTQHAPIVLRGGCRLAIRGSSWERKLTKKSRQKATRTSRELFRAWDAAARWRARDVS